MQGSEFNFRHWKTQSTEKPVCTHYFTIPFCLGLMKKNWKLCLKWLQGKKCNFFTESTFSAWTLGTSSIYVASSMLCPWHVFKDKLSNLFGKKMVIIRASLTITKPIRSLPQNNPQCPRNYWWLVWDHCLTHSQVPWPSFLQCFPGSLSHTCQKCPNTQRLYIMIEVC